MLQPACAAHLPHAPYDLTACELTCCSVIYVQLEMILQASEYEAAQGLDLQEFFTSTEGRFRTELGRSWASEILAQRAAQRVDAELS